ncbi:hypothetical protein [Nocardia sp. NPDC052566]|uniref:hypothetical protein n=1 Tax=Nocardia sp. NPDC052566 TaxID=3364330 RepID=UPI0037CB5E50
MDDGKTGDLFGYSWRNHDWSPADKGPIRPSKDRRLFEDKPVATYDPKSPNIESLRRQPRTNDSEVQLLEELARRHLEDVSGYSRKQVETAIWRAVKKVTRDIENGRVTYEAGVPGEIARTKDRVLEAINELNKIGLRDANRAGTEYVPVTVGDITGDVRLVIDFPHGRNFPAYRQICESCSDVIEAYQKAFPGIRFEARNLTQERLG